MGFDYKSFSKFSDDFKAMSIEFDKFVHDFLTKCALEVLANTKKRTPTDSGELRRNWEVTRVIRRNNELLIYLYNSKDYASYVEFGHATKNREGFIDGIFMATISIDEVERKIPARFEREFKRFMQRMEVG